MCTGRIQCLLPCQRSCECKTCSFVLDVWNSAAFLVSVMLYFLSFFSFKIKIEAKKGQNKTKKNLRQKHAATQDLLLAAAMFVVCHRREQDADPGCNAVLSSFTLAFFLLWWPLFLTLFLLDKINLHGSDSLSVLVWVLCQVRMRN